MADTRKRGYLLEDFRLFHLRGAQGVKAEYHYHEFCKLLLLVSGRGGYVVDGQRYLLQPGDVVLIGAGDQITADGTVLGGEARLNESLITGESDAVIINRNVKEDA